MNKVTQVKGRIFFCVIAEKWPMFKNLRDTKQARKLALDLSHLAYSYVSSYHPTIDYNQSILKIINDTSNFWPIKGDPTLLREGQL